MKLVSFHLMPYRPLDLEQAAKHRSAWVVLPNRLYDPADEGRSPFAEAGVTLPDGTPFDYRIVSAVYAGEGAAR